MKSYHGAASESSELRGFVQCLQLIDALGNVACCSNFPPTARAARRANLMRVMEADKVWASCQNADWLNSFEMSLLRHVILEPSSGKKRAQEPHHCRLQQRVRPLLFQKKLLSTSHPCRFSWEATALPLDSRKVHGVRRQEYILYTTKSLLHDTWSPW